MPIPLRWQWKIDRVRDAITGIFRSNPENARPRMCPACGTLVGTTATKCHVCGANVRFGMAAAGKSLGRMMPTNAPVTYCILSLCCLLYGICLLYSTRSGNPLMPQGGGLSAILNIGAIDGKTSLLLGSTLPLAIHRRVQPMVAPDHRNFSSRQPDAHRLQHVGDHGHRPHGRRTFRLRAVFISLHRHRRVRLSGQFVFWQSQRWRVRRAARTNRHPPRNNHAKQQRVIANAALQPDQMDHLYRHHGLHVFGHR